MAALAALLFTWMQVGQATKELRISEQGQITNRFNTAITNLGSSSPDVRLGGIYALERIMQDSDRDEGTITAIMTAYVRLHAPLSEGDAKKTHSGSDKDSPPVDIAAVMDVLADLPELEGGYFHYVDLGHTNLRGLDVGGRSGNFEAAYFEGADLSDANLNSALLHSADFAEANLHGADLSFTDLSDAYLVDADLSNAILAGADLRKANFTGADLTKADLRTADFSGALLKGVNLKGAKLDGARGLPPSLR
ncbi:pentapeptide repeat-containing protein [Streptomyces spororaveus]|uniref:pentapeptide repeat-containing protein n=1 Tax=Streptomyces spororaveus TaxID=284039 RepID=UPI0036B11641